MRKRTWAVIVLMLLLLGGAWWEHWTSPSPRGQQSKVAITSPLSLDDGDWRSPPSPLPPLPTSSQGEPDLPPQASHLPLPAKEENSATRTAQPVQSQVSVPPGGSSLPWRVVHGRKVITTGEEGEDATRRLQLAIATVMESLGGGTALEMDFESTSTVPPLLVAPPDADITPKVIAEYRRLLQEERQRLSGDQ